MTPQQRLLSQLTFLYGEATAAKLWSELATRLDAFARRHPDLQDGARPLSERDAILITYGDQFQARGEAPLSTLKRFLDDHLSDAINGVHILPCFPYSSDDGFAVIDYHQIDPKLGAWEDIERLGQDYRLMFDAVINHVSRKSAWFERFRRGEHEYQSYFIVADPEADLSAVVRPRALPLLTPVETAAGLKHVWTTFSADQIDLNYANPQVQLEIIDVLLDYVAHGAKIIRLDAIAYLWKEIGTSCIHLPQTHAVVKLWRAVLDAIAPGVILITETNVPHEENISYFGEALADGGTDEAQMVYNFTLAPLTLHAFRTGDAGHLSRWAAALDPPPGGATFFNFIASHDGIGMRPAEGILSPAEIEALAEQTLRHGGQVSYRNHPDGSRSVYELNTTLFDFLNAPANPTQLDIPRFLASQAILLSLAGVPGIYVHSLFGSRNCHACMTETGRARSLNREKFALSDLETRLAQANSRQRLTLDGYLRLLRLRRQLPAFHPAAAQRVLDLNPAVFALVRETGAPGDDVVVALINVSDRRQPLVVDSTALGIPAARRWLDLVGERDYASTSDTISLELQPYQVMWLMPANLDS